MPKTNIRPISSFENDQSRDNYMKISKIKIENYKCFKQFTLELNPKVNILVGNNESGKSTILEAINLALTGLLNGRYLRNELSPYLFNDLTTQSFTDSLEKGGDVAQSPPYICIEVFFGCKDVPQFKGNGNSEKRDACGVSLKIEFDPDYQAEYEALVQSNKLKSIPIEYYRISWQSFARDAITARSIPLKSALIDSSSNRYQNGSDVYISRIIHSGLEDGEKAAISQEYRKLKEQFGEAKSVKAINEKIKDKSNISDRDLSISVDLATHNAWQTTLMTYLDKIPFHQAGKGDQCVVKTNLALDHKKNQKAGLVLLEEPENHLSHTRLNQLLANIEKRCKDKQTIISTHSSFVANKLGFENIIFLNDKHGASFAKFPADTFNFFKKLPGYQTLRLLLCRKAVLVEGPSDELIFQKAYMNAEGKLPIANGIDVISVGLSFKRFLEIAKMAKQPTAVITDNDGDFEKNITKKYKDVNDVSCIEIFADDRCNLKTLEPQFVDANLDNLPTLYKIFKLNKGAETYDIEEKITKYMSGNKTGWALQVFESGERISFPKYIIDAVAWCNE